MRTSSLAALVSAVLALVALSGAGSVPAATAPTVVTIQFDDGTADQYGALAILNAHGMHATFYAETIPPLDAYATRTPPNPKQGTTLATIESYVTAAENDGGGWVQLVFHHLCDQCDAYSITPANFTALLDWLQPRAARGTTVETTAAVVGGPAQPPVAP